MLESGINRWRPKLDLSDLPDEGKPLKFSIEVAVGRRELGEYKGLEVGREEPRFPRRPSRGAEAPAGGFARLNPSSVRRRRATSS
jgi:hypothetical protein